MSAKRFQVLSLALIGMLPACTATSPAPKAFRQTITNAQKIALGSWTRVDGRVFSADGELLAVDPRDIYLERDAHVTIVNPACVNKLTIAAFESENEGVQGLGALGLLSTLSHGFILVVSMPIWAITTASTSYRQSGAGYLDYKREGNGPINTQPARKWARFPQGMPPGYLETVKGIRISDANCAPVDTKTYRTITEPTGKPQP